MVRVQFVPHGLIEMKKDSKTKRCRTVHNVPRYVTLRIGDELYGPNDSFPYIIRDIGKSLAKLFGREVFRRLASRQQRAVTPPERKAT